MNKFLSKVTSDLICNSLCAVTIGAGIFEYTTNVFFNDTYVKYSKEAYRYLRFEIVIKFQIKLLSTLVVIRLIITEVLESKVWGALHYIL